VTAQRRAPGLPAGWNPSFRGELAQARRLTALIRQARRQGSRVLFLGVGNELRGDDAVGVLVVADLATANDELFTAVPVGVAVENASHLPRRLQANVVVIVDAAVADGRRLRPWQLLSPETADSFCHTTHTVPLSLLVRYWQHERPGLQVELLGIRIVGGQDDAPLSAEVERVRESIVAVIRGALTS
jgi:hydrogenase 3 maturation protease